MIPGRIQIHTCIAGLICIISSLVHPVVAQDNTSLDPSGKDTTDLESVTRINDLAPHVHEFSLWGGYASESLQLWGKTPEATLSLIGIRYNRKFLKIYNSTLEYSLEVNLYARYTYPEFTTDRRINSVSGGGFAPLGFQLNFIDNQRLQPFLKTSGGLMFLSEPFPDARGRKMNFTFGAGAGLEYMINSHVSFSLGYRFFHLSNGETGEVNPGIDSNFFYGGLTFF